MNKDGNSDSFNNDDNLKSIESNNVTAFQNFKEISNIIPFGDEMFVLFLLDFFIFIFIKLSFYKQKTFPKLIIN